MSLAVSVKARRRRHPQQRLTELYEKGAEMTSIEAEDQQSLKAEEFSTILVTETVECVHLTLHRPAARNAINLRMVQELHRVCEYLELFPKVLVIAGLPEGEDGSPPVFASGADIAELRERRRAAGLRGINAQLFDRIARLPMPVIALLDGYVLGGGAELACAADLRIGTPRMKFGNPEASLGIMAAAGGTWRLLELAGEAITKEILLAGRVLDGDECFRFGLISQLVAPSELQQRGDELLTQILRQDPTAIQVTKKVLSMPRAAHPAVDTIAQALLFESEEKFARMDAFLHRPRT